MQRKKLIEITFISVMLLLEAITFFSPSAFNRIFFYDRDDFGMDFFNVLEFVYNKTPYPLGSYPPLSFLLIYPFSQFNDFENLTAKSVRSTQMGMLSFTVYTAVSFFIFALLLYECKNGRKAIRVLTIFALLFSGISLFTLERGNLIWLGVITTSFFLMYYKHENPILRELSYIALALSAGIKMFPCVLGVLLIYDKHFWMEKQFARPLRLLIYGILAFFAPFLFFKGGFSNISVFYNSVQDFSNSLEILHVKLVHYTIGFGALGIFFDFNHVTKVFLSSLSLPLLIVCVMTAWSLEKNWKVLFALISAMILFLSCNSAYYIIFLFIPVILFLNEEEHSPTDWFYLIAMIVILCPYPILYVRHFKPERYYPFHYYIKQPMQYVIANCTLIMVFLTLCTESLIRSIRIYSSFLVLRRSQAALLSKR